MSLKIISVYFTVLFLFGCADLHPYDSTESQQNYSFELFTKSFEDLTGEPWMTLNTKGMKIKYFEYPGSFQAISDRAKILLDRMKALEKNSEATEGASAGVDLLKKEGMQIVNHFMREVSPNIYVMIILTIGENDKKTLAISETSLAAFEKRENDETDDEEDEGE